MLAVDGSSPYAKVLLQRKRRLQVVRGKTMIEKMNALQLTPGTQLMYDIEKYLKKYVERLKNELSYLKISYVISSAKSPDEGELKIFDIFGMQN